MGIHRYFGAAMLAGIVLMGSVSGASAASYQMIDGTIVDPILCTGCSPDNTWQGGDVHLGPGVSIEIKNAFEIDLRYANLRWSDLSGSSLATALLVGSDFTGADLSDSLIAAGTAAGYATFRGADLSNVRALNVNFTNADFTYANLTGANIFVFADEHFPADMSHATLFGACLACDTDLSFADVTWTGAKYSLNAVDNNGNPIPDTTFPSAPFDPIL